MEYKTKIPFKLDERNFNGRTYHSDNFKRVLKEKFDKEGLDITACISKESPFIIDNLATIGIVKEYDIKESGEVEFTVDIFNEKIISLIKSGISFAVSPTSEALVDPVGNVSISELLNINLMDSERNNVFLQN